MIEFGSDFHMCNNGYHKINSPFNFLSDNIRYYASGRHAIEALISQEKWKRIWLPAYFCYEVISYIKTTGIQIKFYDDHPLLVNEDNTLRTLPFIEGDVLFRINYFGLRKYRSNRDISIPVVEDHTHSILSYWALNSDADWCISSVRKSIPVPAGGVLWSPKNKRLPIQIDSSSECEAMAHTRFKAMNLKSNYLKNGGDKSEFRKMYIMSEEIISSLKLSGMDSYSLSILLNFDIHKWYKQKTINWNIALKTLNTKVNILKPENVFDSAPFSITVLCNSFSERTEFRSYLIEHNVFPAVLWQVPENILFDQAKDISDRILSIHCDARYNEADILQLCKIINSFYDLYL